MVNVCKGYYVLEYWLVVMEIEFVYCLFYDFFGLFLEEEDIYKDQEINVCGINEYIKQL